MRGCREKEIRTFAFLLPSCRHAFFVLEPPQVFNASADNLDMDTKVSAETRNQGLGRRANGCSPQTQGLESVHRSPDVLPAEEDRRSPTLSPTLSNSSVLSVASVTNAYQRPKPEISGQKHPRVIFRTFSANDLHHHCRTEVRFCLLPFVSIRVHSWLPATASVVPYRAVNPCKAM